MLDFLVVSHRKAKGGGVEIYPKFKIQKSNDLMIRGGDFYAIWNKERGLWSTDEGDVIYLIDKSMEEYTERYIKENPGVDTRIQYMWDSETGIIDKWHRYCQKQLRDNFHMLDEKLVFANTEVKKRDYVSKKLEYPLEPGDISAYDKLISTLYSEEERHKLEWAIGSIVTGDSKKIQKFIVLYGEAGTGKSTILNIIQELFEGYYSVFDAKALGSSSNVFALEAFKSNPLVAIQHDGDLSKIEDNTRLNSLVSHELMTINEKFKGIYSSRFKSFLFMGTNKPVKITDAKSGLIRRLIDVSPSGNKLSAKEYKQAMNQIPFELGAIAYHCKEVYLSDPGKYDKYIPTSMMSASNDFYNFVSDFAHVFKREDGTTLKAAWEMYKTYCDEAKVPYPYSQRIFKEELRNYFWDFKERDTLEDGTRVRNRYTGFRTDKFIGEVETSNEQEERFSRIDFREVCDNWRSEFDIKNSECPAQYGSSKETPKQSWDKVKTKLSEINTSKLHYVRVPENHIVIDFDIKDSSGNKSFEKNLEEASKWPATYAELSKSGGGIHLHYIYSGDVSKLSRVYDDHIEVKVFTGKSSLRRKLTKCNNLPIATINSGLPLKGEKKMINDEAIKSERVLRTLIKRNLNKEIHPNTKPSIDYIHFLLDKAYNQGLHYDVTDMQNAVLAFGASSNNQSDYCIDLVSKMKFKSDDISPSGEYITDAPIVFYDVEVFPNLFLVNWKFEGEDKPVVRMINPKPAEIEALMKFKLIGFNCRRYDNHMLYARMLGYTEEEIFNLSQRIVGSKKGEGNRYLFGEAYNISYTDVYDYAAKKQSLKKWEIELGIHHQELGLPWDEPVPEELWYKVAEYCDNDVIATEAVHNHLKGDFLAREILADLAGMTPNDTTNSLTTRIIFGKERNPQLVYTDLATGERSDGIVDNDIINAFPGYEFVYDNADKKYHNMFRGIDVGKGGYVYAEPGMYGNVALLDVASMHPSSIINMNCFGEYTQNFKDIKDTRMYIKHGDFETAKKLFDGRLAKYLDDPAQAKALSQALKIAINSVYGLTSASYDNPFRDSRNTNNIVALRGALFMKTLQDELQGMGFTVAHIKTDSIKIPDATPEIIKFVMDFGKKYGYEFEHEATYEKMCLVNDAVYVAQYTDGTWTATGTQFQIPYVFKKLFSKEDILFNDLCETKSVTTALHLDMNEHITQTPDVEKELEKREKAYKIGGKPDYDIYFNDKFMKVSDDELKESIAKQHDYRFIGKVGQFTPIKPGYGGGLICRHALDKDGHVKYYSATGAKGYRWLESEVVYSDKKLRDAIDYSYFNELVDDAVETISKYGDFEWFASDEPYHNSVLWGERNLPF